MPLLEQDRATHVHCTDRVTLVSEFTVYRPKSYTADFVCISIQTLIRTLREVKLNIAVLRVARLQLLPTALAYKFANQSAVARTCASANAICAERSPNFLPSIHVSGQSCLAVTCGCTSVVILVYRIGSADTAVPSWLNSQCRCFKSHNSLYHYSWIIRYSPAKTAACQQLQACAKSKSLKRQHDSSMQNADLCAVWFDHFMTARENAGCPHRKLKTVPDGYTAPV